jgi:hypothetical protein
LETARERSLNDVVPPKRDDVVFKALIDLWMHQNKLMWDRLRIVGILQFGLLGAGFYLQNRNGSVSDKGLLKYYPVLACLTAIFATIVLWHRASVDRRWRDSFQERLIAMGFVVGLPRSKIDSRRFFGLVFLGLVAMDVVAAILLWNSN